MNSFLWKISKSMPLSTYILESNLPLISCLFFRNNKLKFRKKKSKMRRKSKAIINSIGSFGDLIKKLRKRKKKKISLALML